MSSHYLFFRPENGHKFVDVMRPRVRTGERTKSFSFETQHRSEYQDLALYVMNNSQRQRLMGEIGGDNSASRKTPIYTVTDMVIAKLIDFTSKSVSEGVHAFRVDFFSPVRRNQFAYLTPYGQGSFGRQHKERTGEELEMLRFTDYKIGDPIGKAILDTFATFDLSVLHNSAFQKYHKRGLALVVSGKLIERE